jgi:hypothetical protein
MVLDLVSRPCHDPPSKGDNDIKRTIKILKVPRMKIVPGFAGSLYCVCFKNRARDCWDSPSDHGEWAGWYQVRHELQEKANQGLTALPEQTNTHDL